MCESFECDSFSNRTDSNSTNWTISNHSRFDSTTTLWYTGYSCDQTTRNLALIQYEAYIPFRDHLNDAILPRNVVAGVGSLSLNRLRAFADQMGRAGQRGFYDEARVDSREKIADAMDEGRRGTLFRGTL